MPDLDRFFVFMAAAFLLFITVLLFCVRGRVKKPSGGTLFALGSIVVVAGMMFARYSHIIFPDLPWEIYYGLPALTTVLVPPVWLRMRQIEVMQYVPLALLMAPTIHLVFSFFVGWHDYMPFPFHIPSIAELLGARVH